MINNSRKMALTSDLDHSTIAKAAMDWILDGLTPADIYIEEDVNTAHSQYPRYHFLLKKPSTPKDILIFTLVYIWPLGIRIPRQKNFESRTA